MTKFVVSKMYHICRIFYVDADNKDNALAKTIGKKPDRIFENYIKDHPIAVITEEEFTKMHKEDLLMRAVRHPDARNDDDDNKINLAGL